VIRKCFHEAWCGEESLSQMHKQINVSCESLIKERCRSSVSMHVDEHTDRERDPLT
jgi:hypothetical protein